MPPPFPPPNPLLPSTAPLLRNPLHMKLPPMLHEMIIPGKPLIPLPHTPLKRTVNIPPLMRTPHMSRDVCFPRKEFDRGACARIGAVGMGTVGAVVGADGGDLLCESVWGVR